VGLLCSVLYEHLTILHLPKPRLTAFLLHQMVWFIHMTDLTKSFDSYSFRHQMKSVSLCFGDHEKADKTKLKFPWGWTVRGSNSGRGKRFFYSPKSPRPAVGPIQPPIQWDTAVCFGGQRGRSVKLTTHLHLVPRLRKSGVISLLPPAHPFKAWTGTAFSCTLLQHAEYTASTYHKLTFWRRDYFLNFSTPCI
jgi:hypothetical protein